MTEKKNIHAPQLQFPVIDDCLHIGGVALTRLVQRVGKTPFYAYDRQVITKRVQSLRSLLPEKVRLHYSVKANPMPAVVQHLAGLVDGLDVASGNELKVALDTPIKSARISFAGPGKTDAELMQAIAAGCIITLESEGEMKRVEQFANVLGITPKVLVRVNPDFELKLSGMKMGGGAKPFGIDAEQVPALLKQIGAAGIDFQGFHIFSGSQSLKSASIMEAESNTFQLALRLAEHAPSAVRLLNIGGGFGIPYFPGEQPLDMAPIAENLGRWILDIKSQLPEAAVAVELGRYLVGEAGVYVTRIIDRKESRGKIFLVTDGGMNHHLAASGNLGQVIRKNYPVVIGNKINGTKREVVSVVGPLCTPLDTLADKVEMACAEPGDVVVVFQSGAYGLTASPTGFLSHARPDEVLV